MTKWTKCEDCARNNRLGEPICQTCIAGSNFSPRERSRAKWTDEYLEKEDK